MAVLDLSSVSKAFQGKAQTRLSFNRLCLCSSALTHVVDITFLYAYREPTFGILSAPIQASSALLEERRDLLMYTVFTLDLDLDSRCKTA